MKLSSWSLSILFLSMTLASLYLFDSGVPQVADLVMVIYILLTFLWVLSVGVKIPEVLLFKIWFLLCAWISVVSLSWSFIYQSWSFLIHPLFYVYNLLVCFSIFVCLEKMDRTAIFFKNAVICSLLVSGLGVAANFGTEIRATGFFNNPNQLAYFSLCAMSLMILLYRFTLPFALIPMLAIISGVIGVFSASSLAGMAGFLLIVSSYILANTSNTKRIFKIFCIIPILLVLVVILDFSTGGVVSDNVLKRFDRADSKVDDIYSERKYERIFEFPEHLILGAGEGHTERFYPFDGGEIHSTYGNIAFSYGVVGIFLFLCLLYIILRRCPVYVIVLLSAPLIYSVTHMGSRTTFFWLVMFYAWYSYSYKTKPLSNLENFN